jgi:hypothetical protein
MVNNAHEIDSASDDTICSVRFECELGFGGTSPRPYLKEIQTRHMSQPTSAARRMRVLLAHVNSDATPPRINCVAANAPAPVAAKWLPMAFSPEVQAALSSGAPVVALELRVNATLCHPHR